MVHRGRLLYVMSRMVHELVIRARRFKLREMLARVDDGAPTGTQATCSHVLRCHGCCWLQIMRSHKLSPESSGQRGSDDTLNRSSKQAVTPDGRRTRMRSAGRSNRRACGRAWTPVRERLRARGTGIFEWCTRLARRTGVSQVKLARRQQVGMPDDVEIAIRSVPWAEQASDTTHRLAHLQPTNMLRHAIDRGPWIGAPRRK